MPDPVASSSRMALVADGSRYSARVIRDVLARLGIRQVVEAKDGAEAVSALDEREPALLVLDWGLPVISAREVLAMARDGRRTHAPALSVIVTMAEPTRSAVEAALAFRVDAILAAPFSPRELRLRLQRAIRRPGAANGDRARTD